MGKKLDEKKLKAHLTLTSTRLSLQKKKRLNRVDQQKRSIADLLAKGKEEEARLLAEEVIKEEETCQGYEILELFCQVVGARMSVMALSKAVPPELEEAIASLCWTASRHSNLSELVVVRAVLAAKYGKDVIGSMCTNANGQVNKDVVKKLSISTPSPQAVTRTLSAVAAKYNVDWVAEIVPDENGVFPEAASGKSLASAATISANVFPTTGRGKADIPAPPSDLGDDDGAFPEPPDFSGIGQAPTRHPRKEPRKKESKPVDNFPVMSVGDIPGSGGGGRGAAAGDDDDDLLARFAALKQ